MSETLFGKHSLEIIVRPEDHPGLLSQAYDTATISIGQIIFVGEITNVQSKKIKDKESGETENWVTVRLNVTIISSVMECSIEHPGVKQEIMDKIVFNYSGVELDSNVSINDDFFSGKNND